jgi:hypothetical protein
LEAGQSRTTGEVPDATTLAGYPVVPIFVEVPPSLKSMVPVLTEILALTAAAVEHARGDQPLLDRFAMGERSRQGRQASAHPAVRLHAGGCARWKEPTGGKVVRLRALALSQRWDVAMALFLPELRKEVRRAG